MAPPSNRHTDRYLPDDFGAEDGALSHQAEFSLNSRETLRRFLIVLQEKKWFFSLIFLLLFGMVAAMSFLSTPMYRATATLELLRQEEQRSGFERVIDFDVRTPEDFNTRIKVLESGNIVAGVVDRLEKSGQLERLRRPFRDDDRTAEEIVMDHRKIVPVRGSRYVSVEFAHPSPKLAANVANLIVNEYLRYNAALRRESARSAVADLREQAEAQLERVEEVEFQLADFKERHSTVSLDHGSDFNADELRQLNEILTRTRRDLDQAEARWVMVDAARSRGEPLWEIGFLVDGEHIEQILLDLARLQIRQSGLAERYRPAHPKMVEINRQVAETAQLLNEALHSAAVAVENEYSLAAEAFASTLMRINEVTAENFALDKIRPEYSSLQRKLQVNDEMYRQLYNRMQEAETQLIEDIQSGRIVDRAAPPIEPFSPRHAVNLILGVFLGGLGGSVFVLLCVLLDNRLKSVADVELSLQLPVLGVIPSIKKTQGRKHPGLLGRMTEHSLGVEAFRTVLSAIRISSLGHNAQVLVVTSTLPSEGKSLIASNLAYTSSSLGERTLLIDADLRLPSVARNLEIDDTEGGFIPVLEGKMGFDDAVVREFAPNLDVLPSGGRSANPQYLFNQPAFLELLGELRGQYDRIFLDATPLAPVSDVLSVFRHTDGVIYAVHFGKVNRNIARNNVRRLLESETPVIGAVLNNVSLQSGHHYYPDHYDRRYQGYYANPVVAESSNGHATPDRNGRSKAARSNQDPVSVE